MAIKDEAGVKKEVKRILKSYKPSLHWWMPSASMYGVSGQHDFIICQHGLLWTIETKYGRNVPTDNQISFAEDIRQAGGLSLCINETNLNEVSRVASYINDHISFPSVWGHDFTQWRKDANKKRRGTTKSQRSELDSRGDSES